MSLNKKTFFGWGFFELLRTGEVVIQNFRFGAIFTQAFPLLAAKAGLLLTQVAGLYSLAFIILPLHHPPKRGFVLYNLMGFPY